MKKIAILLLISFGVLFREAYSMEFLKGAISVEVAKKIITSDPARLLLVGAVNGLLNEAVMRSVLNKNVPLPCKKFVDEPKSWKKSALHGSLSMVPSIVTGLVFYRNTHLLRYHDIVRIALVHLPIYMLNSALLEYLFCKDVSQNNITNGEINPTIRENYNSLKKDMNLVIGCGILTCVIEHYASAYWHHTH